MATAANPKDVQVDRNVPEPLLIRIAHRLYPQHLERFATTLLGIEEAEYFHLIDSALNEPWRKCFYVLRAWYNQSIRTIRDLCTLLREAERLGFVQRGTHDDLVTGRLWDLSYLAQGHWGPYPDFASIVAPWYIDPIWQNMLLFPWMDEEALQLSEVCTALEFESVLGSGKTKQLKDYKDVFKDRKSEGTRILIKGDQGIGKTVFVHKVAYDWSVGGLDTFDIVLVVMLKLADKNQSIAGMIKSQIKPLWEDDSVSEAVIEEYLKAGRGRVLLVLDGFDEIDLNKYPQVQEVLTGHTFRKCCVLATARPYVAETLQSKMPVVLKMTGFTRAQAQKYVSHILPDDEDRKNFFHQLEEGRMSEAYKIPMLVQQEHGVDLLKDAKERSELIVTSGESTENDDFVKQTLPDMCGETTELQLTTTVLRHLKQLRPEPLPPEYTSSCPITISKNCRKYIATVSHGEAKTLQGPNSDVSLQVAAGCAGVYITRVHTDHVRFKDVIPEEECIIGPPVEVERRDLSQSSAKSTSKPVIHTVRIPHCVRDRSLWKYFKVRRGDVYECGVFQELERRETTEEAGEFYIVEESHVVIFTSTFSQFICTSCQNTCHATIMVFLLGHLEALEQNNNTTTKIKVFMCSDLYRIEDFRSKLLELQLPCRLVLVADQSLEIDCPNFDPTQSRVTITICKAQAESGQWIPSMDDALYWHGTENHFVKSTSLSGVMHLEGCHLCRSPYPRDAMTVDYFSSRLRQQFLGSLKLVVHAAERNTAEGGIGNMMNFFYRPFRQDTDSDGDRLNYGAQISFTLHNDDFYKVLSGLGRTANAALATPFVQYMAAGSHAPQYHHQMLQLHKDELTDAGLLNLSRQITETEDLNTLAINGLNIPDHVVSSHLGQSDAVHLAAHGVLKAWRNSQPDRRIAYTNLCLALRLVNMPFYIHYI